MRRPPLPPSLAAEPFAVQSALAAGVTPSRLRASDLIAPFHGVRAVRLDTADPIAMARAYAPRLGAGRMFSHVTAAQLYDLRLPLALEQAASVHVAAVLPQRPQRGRGVIGHKLTPGTASLRTWRGLPVVDPITAWMQIAPLLTLDELVVAGDALVRRVRPLASVEELRERVGQMRGIRGRVRLLAAAPLIRPLTDSAPETRLRLLLVRAGLPEPVVGYRVRLANGDFLATPDLAYPRRRVALEYDGDVHRTSKWQFREDISRYELLHDEGWRVIRVIADDLTFRSPILIARVRAALR